MISYLQVENLTKSFGDNLLFENISFGIADNQRMALIAKNGTGKTTLLNILSGKEDYESGTISFRRDLRIAYLDQDPDFPKELTVLDACLQTDSEVVRTIAQYEHCMLSVDQAGLDEILANMDLLKAWDYEQRITQILGKLKITNLDQLIGELSGGQLKRVALFSENLTRFTKWNGRVDITGKDKIRLQNVIDSVHTLNSKIRFWNAPDDVNAWKFFMSLKVDYINTDHITMLYDFLNKKEMIQRKR